MFAKKVRSSVKIEIVEKYVRSPRDAVVPSLEESGCCRFAADGTHLPCFVGSCLSASWPAEVFQTPQKKKKSSQCFDGLWHVFNIKPRFVESEDVL